ncbi:MAG: HDIG domain-containing metalloprotein, partial [Planctomycetota bacterium]
MRDGRMKTAVARNGWGLGPAFGAAAVALGVPLLSAVWMAPGQLGTLFTVHANSGDSLVHIEISKSLVNNLGPVSYGVGAGLLLALLVLLVVAMRTPAPRTRPSPRMAPALLVTLAAIALAAALSQIRPLSSNLWIAPVLFPAGLILAPAAALCSARYASALAACFALAAAGGVILAGIAQPISVPAPDLMMFTAALAGGMTAAATGGRAEHPAQLVTGGLLVGGAQGIAAVAVYFLVLKNGAADPAAAVPPIAELGGIVGLGVAFGAGQGALLRLTLPVLERVSSRISAITLARWADMHHPLLERLKREAPGTFHHSQAVGALAATCAREIGADPYIARVGGYYHDIGKIRRPEAFGENTPDTCHRELSPGESASLILAHVRDGADLAREYVRDGADLAREYSLPQMLTDFIVQHHGTTVVEFFYNKAKEAAKRGEGKSPRRDDYTYAGPRPQSIESALVMLVDSAEAASRSLENPSVAEIRDIVEKIFRNKLGAFQFDECFITAAEMGVARDIIVRELAASRHTRPEYPDTEYPTQAISSDA